MTPVAPSWTVPGELSGLSTAELMELRRVIARDSIGGDAGDPSYDRAGKAIVAELLLRVCTQAAIDAKAAAIVDEERRLACARGER
jgi:hypothetical protein